MKKHKVFISFRHDGDKRYKKALVKLNEEHKIFIDRSIDTGAIEDNLPDETKRIKIRDEYLRDSTVTILLVGPDTRNRKHIDWEIYSSMRDSEKNKKSGLMVINLPTAYPKGCLSMAPHGLFEKIQIHPDIACWDSFDSNKEFIDTYPHMPARITNSILNKNAKISIVPWSKIDNSPEILRQLIEFAHDDRKECEYDLSDPMRKNNS